MNNFTNNEKILIDQLNSSNQELLKSFAARVNYIRELLRAGHINDADILLGRLSESLPAPSDLNIRAAKNG